MALTDCLVSFLFTLKNSLQHIFQGRSSGKKLLQLLSGNVLISPSLFSFLNEWLALKVRCVTHKSSNFLGDFSQPPKFLMRNLPIFLLRMPCMWWVDSLLLLSRFCLNEQTKQRQGHRYRQQTDGYDAKGFGQLGEKGKGIKMYKLVVMGASRM